MITWPGGLPGDCWQVHNTFSRCADTTDEMPTWCDGSPADQQWRAAAYERAAVWPCLSPVEGYALFGRACWEMCPGPQSSCGGTSWCTK